MEKIKNVLAVFIVIMFLPYVITILLNGKTGEEKQRKDTDGQLVYAEKNGIKEQIELDEYILGLVANQIPVTYELEALKAQAVIVRTNLYHELGAESLDSYVFSYNYVSYSEMEEMWGRAKFTENYDKLKKAVTDTEDYMLYYQDALIEAPYHAVSSGKTRSGQEVFGGEEYGFLVSAECDADVEAEEYLKLTVFTPEQLINGCKTIDGQVELEEENLISQITITETDGAGYVKKIEAGGISLSGEEFRTVMELNSSCFSLQEYHGNIRITTKGLGHGMGLSQYSANEFAKEGKGWEEILNHFYHEITIDHKK